MAEDDDFSDTSDLPSSNVQLGFVEEGRNEMFLSTRWQDWDGGKIGGWPIWLNPGKIPKLKEVSCYVCSDPMRFLLQIYCPLSQPSAFHRALYLFCCKKSSCVSRGSVRCLRSQLPRENEYYPHDSTGAVDHDATSALSTRSLPVACHVCRVCGGAGTFSCSRCSSVHYCSPAHQKTHWKHHKPECKASIATAAGGGGGGRGKAEGGATALSMSTDQWREWELLSVQRLWSYPVHNLCVSEEILAEEDILAEPKEAVEMWEGADESEKGEDGVDDDENLTQSQYNQALGNRQHDVGFDRFMHRVRRGGSEQVLRYSRWCEEAGAGPLSISSNLRIASVAGQEEAGGSSGGCAAVADVAGGAAGEVSGCGASGRLCKHCGSPMKFEFQSHLSDNVVMQVMPQLLHFLAVDQHTGVIPATEDSGSSQMQFFHRSGEDVDWGTLDVYTCVSSCEPTDHSCREELVLVSFPDIASPESGDFALPPPAAGSSPVDATAAISAVTPPPPPPPSSLPSDT